MSLSGSGLQPDVPGSDHGPAQQRGHDLRRGRGQPRELEPEYPAGFDGVISVSAVGSTRSLAPYSNFGSTIDVAAPGGDFRRDIDGDGFPDGVLSTFFEDGSGFGYAFYQGTSMAAPHVAGVLALMLGINPGLTPFDIDNAINAHEITEDIGSSQFFGDGLIDATRAVNFAATEVGGGTVLDPVLNVDPDGLNFGFLTTELQLSATNGGNEQSRSRSRARPSRATTVAHGSR